MELPIVPSAYAKPKWTQEQINRLKEMIAVMSAEDLIKAIRQALEPTKRGITARDKFVLDYYEAGTPEEKRKFKNTVYRNIGFSNFWFPMPPTSKIPRKLHNKFGRYIGGPGLERIWDWHTGGYGIDKDNIELPAFVNALQPAYKKARKLAAEKAALITQLKGLTDAELAKIKPGATVKSLKESIEKALYVDDLAPAKKIVEAAEEKKAQEAKRLAKKKEDLLKQLAGFTDAEIGKIWPGLTAKAVKNTVEQATSVDGLGFATNIVKAANKNKAEAQKKQADIQAEKKRKEEAEARPRQEQIPSRVSAPVGTQAQLNTLMNRLREVSRNAWNAMRGANRAYQARNTNTVTAAADAAATWAAEAARLQAQIAALAGRAGQPRLAAQAAEIAGRANTYARTARNIANAAVTPRRPTWWTAKKNQPIKTTPFTIPAFADQFRAQLLNRQVQPGERVLASFSITPGFMPSGGSFGPVPIGPIAFTTIAGATRVEITWTSGAAVPGVPGDFVSLTLDDGVGAFAPVWNAGTTPPVTDTSPAWWTSTGGAAWITAALDNLTPGGWNPGTFTVTWYGK